MQNQVGLKSKRKEDAIMHIIMRECLTLFPGQGDFLPWRWTGLSPESVKRNQRFAHNSNDVRDLKRKKYHGRSEFTLLLRGYDKRLT